MASGMAMRPVWTVGVQHVGLAQLGQHVSCLQIVTVGGV
jgi:hypothetical protein